MIYHLKKDLTSVIEYEYTFDNFTEIVLLRKINDVTMISKELERKQMPKSSRSKPCSYVVQKCLLLNNLVKPVGF